MVDQFCENPLIKLNFKRVSNLHKQKINIKILLRGPKQSVCHI